MKYRLKSYDKTEVTGLYVLQYRFMWFFWFDLCYATPIVIVELLSI